MNTITLVIFWLFLRMVNIKNNALGSKQKQNQKNKIQEKSDQKRRDFIKKLAYHAPKFIKKASINK